MAEEVPERWTVLKVLQWTTERFERAQVDAPRLAAEVLLAHVLGRNRAWLYAWPERQLSRFECRRYDRLIARRVSGRPVAHLIGHREFWSLELAVNDHTLIPRPETETLVNLAICEVPRNAEWQVLDLGTGSGAIAIAVACERQLCEVTAVDISDDALTVARENARLLAPGNVTCLQGDWTEPVRDRVFDLIVSNPPYVRMGDAALAKLRHEPQSALVAGEDGLDAIRVLAADCMALLALGGALMIEHGADQADDVASLLAEHGWRDIACHSDLAGLPRVTVARRSGK